MFRKLIFVLVGLYLVASPGFAQVNLIDFGDFTGLNDNVPAPNTTSFDSAGTPRWTVGDGVGGAQNDWSVQVTPGQAFIGDTAGNVGVFVDAGGNGQERFIEQSVTDNAVADRTSGYYFINFDVTNNLVVPGGTTALLTFTGNPGGGSAGVLVGDIDLATLATGHYSLFTSFNQPIMSAFRLFIKTTGGNFVTGVTGNISFDNIQLIRNTVPELNASAAILPFFALLGLALVLTEKKRASAQAL